MIEARHYYLDSHKEELYKEIIERINDMDDDFSYSKCLFAFKLGLNPEDLTEEIIQKKLKEEEAEHKSFLNSYERAYGVKLEKGNFKSLPNFKPM